MSANDEDQMRTLSDQDFDSVNGARILTTMALGEEDGGWCGGRRYTTMAIGEEGTGPGPTVLDAKLHLGK